MWTGFEKKWITTKNVTKILFLQNFGVFLILGIRNRELILDRFFGTTVIKIFTEKWNRLIYLKEEKLGSCKMTTLPKKRFTFDFVYKNFHSLFLEFKASSCTHVFLLHSFNDSLVDKKILEKKKQPKFLHETL